VSTAVPQVSLLAAVRCIFVRDLRLALRRRADTLAAMIFFVMVVSLFPLGIGPESALLRTMAPGVVWVAALLSSMLSLTRLFADDHQDGTLEQLLLSAHPLAFLALGKIAAHWMSSGLLLVLVAPLLALQFDLSPSACGVLVLSLLLGTPVLSLLGAIGAALTVGLRGGSVLLSLLVLPLAAGRLRPTTPGSVSQPTYHCWAPCWCWPSLRHRWWWRRRCGSRWSRAPMVYRAGCTNFWRRLLGGPL
jgi:heme exporter protein B